MGRFGNLSFERIPPLGVPLRFFLTAPWLGAAAGVALVLWGGAALTMRWAPETLAVVHLVTLGFLLTVMAGAVYQVMPVLTGVPLPGAAALGPWVHAGVLAGALLAPAGLAGVRWAAAAGTAVLGAALAVFLAQGFAAAARVGWRHESGRSVAMALVALAVTAGLGLHLLAGHAGWGVLARQLTDLHWVWALAGWLGLLVMGVGFQVVPMFQVTPPYPKPVTCCLPAALLGLLALWSGTRGVPAAEVAAAALIGLAAATFAAATLVLQQRRKRKVWDVTVAFWRLGMGALLAGLVAVAAARAAGDARLALLAGILLLAGWGVSLVSGMLYKIVPFLAWLHLQNVLVARSLLGRHRIPNMKQFVDDGRARLQFRLHAAALALLAAAPWAGDAAARLAGLLLALSFALLGVNLAAAARRYRHERARLDAAG
ncbi:hypothetical protein [Inmirania thermothiophila]|uniref:Uncharacterized protein n=1 Tax=Inmirania thermothiophila TaxID=1750597 RepID=A0A3N1XTN8_9GAMM|nr:hypothetical protein [Inmirania thermothiophila]ROR29531.1 hypothetical protein EDC57_2201 [Inmirania thermothiophila]